MEISKNGHWEKRNWTLGKMVFGELGIGKNGNFEQSKLGKMEIANSENRGE